VKPKQIYHKTKLNQETLLRQQLFSNSSNRSSGDNELQNEQQQIEDINKIIAKQQETQEKVANQMLKSVKAIKENSLLANRIIKSDNNLLSDLNSNAEKNTDNLKQVNDHLSARVSRSCLGSCWIWLVIVLIMVVFIMMVLFMKLFPKKKYYPESDIDSTYKHFINNNTIVIGNQSLHKIEL
jgi:SNARE protein 1